MAWTGEFDDRAHGRSLQIWLDTHANVVALAGTALTAALRSARR